MKRALGRLAAAAALIALTATAQSGFAQKRGGILKLYSPAQSGEHVDARSTDDLNRAGFTGGSNS